MIFQTNRLVVRQFVPDDWADFYALNADPAVKRSIGDGLVNSLENEQLAFDRTLQSYTDKTYPGKWAVILKEEGVLAGACSISPFGQTDDLEIGYRFRPIYWGRGLATELAIGMVDYCFSVLGQSRIVATTNRDNQASMNVLRKAGFQFEGAIIHKNWPVNRFTHTTPRRSPTSSGN